MSQITASTIAHLAKLAHLVVSESVGEKYVIEIQSILHYFEKLAKTDTTGVSPTYQVTGLTNVFRPDVVEPLRVLTQKEALSTAPRSFNGYFVVDSYSKK